MFDNIGKNTLVYPQENLFREDHLRKLRSEILETVNSLPEELKNELQEATFKGVIKAIHKEPEEEIDLTISGLEEALYAATRPEAVHDLERDVKKIELKYKNPETDISVDIKGMSDGRTTTKPELTILFQGEKYSWIR